MNNKFEKFERKKMKIFKNFTKSYKRFLDQWVWRKKKEEIKEILLYAPVDGKVIKLDDDELPDKVFKLIGEGVAILPYKNNFYSPVKGKIEDVFQTKHAYTIKTENNYNCLLHIGIDTVNLKGEGFETKIQKNDQVDKNTLLAIVNLDKIMSTPGCSTYTPIIFVKESIGDKKIKIIKLGEVKKGDIIASI
jgi:glucose-specific phosphotransferase system IIA component